MKQPFNLPFAAVNIVVSSLLLLVFASPKATKADTITYVSVQLQSGQSCSSSNVSSSQCSANAYTPIGTSSAISVAGTASAGASYGILHSASSAIGNCSINGNYNCYDPFAVTSIAQ